MERRLQRLRPVLVGQDLYTPRSVPASRPQGGDHGREVERALASVPATMDRVLEERSYHLLIGVVQLDADDAVQRHGREIGGWS